MASEGTLTRENKRALIAAWLGWAFDGLDGYLYVMVAMPFVTQLVANEHGLSTKLAEDAAAIASLQPEVRSKAAIIQAVFLLGWAVGGAVFGRIGDRLGRSRTLMLTILTYAIFTGMSFFAQAWWHLLIFRFLAALGIGGEWAAGSALVAESLHTKHRAWASATLQSGYIMGCIAAALTSGAMSSLEPKWVFVIGVLPAFIVLWIRKAVPEPEEWAKASREKEPPRISELFAPGLRRTTCLLLAHIAITLTTVWAFLFFSPQMIEKLPEAAEWTKEQKSQTKTMVTVSFFCVNIVANYFATYLAKWIGYRRAFSFMVAGAAVSVLFAYRLPPTLMNVYVMTWLVSFFGLGLFAMFPLYVPPLFPTLLRTLGAGFTYNSGRIIAAAGTLFAGKIASDEHGGPQGAVWWTGLLYIPGFFVCLMLPEPGKLKDKEADDKA